MGFMFCDLHVSLNNPSSGDINSSNLPCLVSVYLKVLDHLTLEFNIWMHMASLNSDFLKFRILKILNFHP